jgi:hypothetical protein
MITVIKLPFYSLQMVTHDDEQGFSSQTSLETVNNALKNRPIRNMQLPIVVNIRITFNHRFEWVLLHILEDRVKGKQHFVLIKLMIQTDDE